MAHNENVLNKIFLDLNISTKVNTRSAYCKKVFDVGKGIGLLWRLLMWNFNYLFWLSFKEEKIFKVVAKNFFKLNLPSHFIYFKI